MVIQNWQWRILCPCEDGATIARAELCQLSYIPSFAEGEIPFFIFYWSSTHHGWLWFYNIRVIIRNYSWNLKTTKKKKRITLSLKIYLIQYTFYWYKVQVKMINSCWRKLHPSLYFWICFLIEYLGHKFANKTAKKKMTKKEKLMRKNKWVFSTL